MFDIQEELKKLPQKPGVYIMRDDDGTVIYVGKAINLKNRVRQYFQPSNADDPKTLGILSVIATFEVIVTSNEVEALILECNLIKMHRPRYNTLLKDDKTYPYIKFTENEDFPRVLFVRKFEKDGAKYFGPYVSSYAVTEVLSLISQLWQLRPCDKKINRPSTDDEKKTRQRPCLNYHIGRCPAPCAGKISYEDYMERAGNVLNFMNGKHGEILRTLEKRMYEFSDNMEYENAADMRNKIMAVKKLSEKQSIDKTNGADRDAIAFAQKDRDVIVQVFFIRGGKLQGRDQFELQVRDESRREDIMTDFIKQYYSDAPFIPSELILQNEPNDKELLTEWLSGQKKRKVSITVPQKGGKRRLVEMAARNSLLALEKSFEQQKKDENKAEKAVNELKSALGLPEEFNLFRIEAYDISNVQGFESVGSMVVYEGGKPLRKDYRKFKIKTVEGANDYASMEEVITRRLKRLVSGEGDEKNAKSFIKKPDMLFIDGGKPQVSAAEKTVASFGLDIPVCGMVKDDRHRTKGILFREEEIYFAKNSEAFLLVTRIQNEVHRFAIEYHRKLREKGMTASVLDTVPGIGATRKKELFRHFGDIPAMKAATREELAAAPSMNAKAADILFEFLSKEQ